MWPLIQAGQGVTPVALLHGFLGRKEDWHPVMATLARRRRCCALDWPGHGEHRVAVIPSWDAVLAGLDGQRVALGLDRWHLAGYSMGGRLALHYALAYPDRVASLTIISASTGIEEDDARDRRKEQDRVWADRLRTLPRATFLRQWYDQPVFASLACRPELLETIIHARQSAADPALLAEALEAWGQGRLPGVRRRLVELRCPVQLVAGELDSLYVERAGELKNLLPGGRVVIVSGAGHVAPLENPEATAEAIITWTNPGT